CVVLATASVDEASRFAESAYSLEHGRIVRRLALGSAAVDASGPVELVVRTSDPRRLVHALADHAEVAAVAWDGRTSPDELNVRGGDLARLSAAIFQVSHAERIALLAVSPKRAGL